MLFLLALSAGQCTETVKASGRPHGVSDFPPNFLPCRERKSCLSPREVQKELAEHSLQKLASAISAQLNGEGFAEGTPPHVQNALISSHLYIPQLFPRQGNWHDLVSHSHIVRGDSAG